MDIEDLLKGLLPTPKMKTEDVMERATTTHEANNLIHDFVAEKIQGGANVNNIVAGVHAISTAAAQYEECFRKLKYLHELGHPLDLDLINDELFKKMKQRIEELKDSLIEA